MKIHNIQEFLNFNDYDNKSIEKDNKFSSFLVEAIKDVNRSQKSSEDYKKMLSIGELDNLHDLTIASEKADIALQVTLGIRNKIVDAYKEIMRIQI